MSTFYYSLANKLSTAIIYSLSGGLIVFTVLLLVLWLFKNSYSRFKYILCQAALVSVFILFCVPFAGLFQNTSGHIVTVNERHTITTPAQPSPKTVIQQVYSFDGAIDTLSDITGRYSLIIFSLYALGLCLFAIRLFLSYYHTLRLKNDGLIAADGYWLSMLEKAGETIGINRAVKIAFSEKVNSPCIIGFSKAIILIPVGLANNLAAEEVEAILLHELAHLKQYDYYLNMLVQLIKCVLFFNPFAWLIIGRINYYRELACDETVALQNRELALAESLVKISQFQSLNNILALNLSANKYTLFNRIQNLLSMKNQKRTTARPASVYIAAMMLTIGMLLFFNSRSLSQENLAKQLEEISRDMFNSGNDRYIVVDAIKDGLLQEGERYDFVFDKGILSLNGKKLSDEYNTFYTNKLKSFYKTTGQNVDSWSSTRGDGPSFKDIFDPKSNLRKRTIMPRHAETGKAHAIVITELVKDGIIDTKSKLHLKYNDKGVFVNEKALSGKQLEKYTRLYADNTGELSKQGNYELSLIMDAEDVKAIVDGKK